MPPDLEPGHYCFFVDETMYVDGKGYRPSVVIEGHPGHFPNGGGDVEPWYWGQNLEVARQICRDRNANMGLSPEDVERIIASSMQAKPPVDILAVCREAATACRHEAENHDDRGDDELAQPWHDLANKLEAAVEAEEIRREAAPTQHWRAFPARQLTGKPHAHHAYIGREKPELPCCTGDHHSPATAEACARDTARQMNARAATTPLADICRDLVGWIEGCFPHAVDRPVELLTEAHTAIAKATT